MQMEAIRLLTWAKHPERIDASVTVLPGSFETNSDRISRQGANACQRQATQRRNENHPAQ
jgi:hypothetical protein